MTLNLPIINNSPASWLCDVPIAHRGLHDIAQDIYENTLTAAAHAVVNKYAIEVDLQLAADGVPVVFHDYTLDRLTDESGNIREVSSEELQKTSIMKTSDRIPTLAQLLETVDGKTPMVLELKGMNGFDTGFVREVARLAKNYEGPIAIMSFSHWLLEDARAVASDMILGLTAEGGENTYSEHQKIAEACSVDFLSYSIEDIDCKFVTDFRDTGRPVISWTVRNAEQLAKSNKYADQVTFEGFVP